MQKLSAYIVMLATFTTMMVTFVNCSNSSAAPNAAANMQAGNNVEDQDKALMLMGTKTRDIWHTHLDSMPGNDCQKLRVNPPAGSLRKWFCDSNYLHYAAGQQLGIEPIIKPSDVLNLNKQLVKIESCGDFFVDSLSHSYPYLVPEAATLLHDIGQAFNDSLRTRGGGCYRLKVTSLLRTDHSIQRLRRVNRIAVDSSSHRFATTFDISYLKFICDAETVNRTQEDLKNLLAEVLHKFHTDNRCLIIYERKQSCFHITVLTPDFVRPLPPKPKKEKA